MIQWIGVGLTVVGMVINGYQQYSKPALTPSAPVVEYYQQQAYYQAVFDPINNKVYVLYPDGRWYEQVPVRNSQTQYPPNLAVGQGSQPAPLGQRIAQQPAQTTPNPWLR
jgi:hypothetical protein